MNPKSSISFTKMSGTGNDFIVFDNRQLGFTQNDSTFFKQICQRRTAIGADGVLLIDVEGTHSLKMQYFNRDGQKAAMCGNGARCAAYFGFQKGVVSNHSFILFSDKDQHDVSVQNKNVALKMSEPFDFQEKLNLSEEPHLKEGGFINTGVPHYVLFVSDIETVDVMRLGQKYRFHKKFAEGANVNFVQQLGENKIKVRTYERGVEEETLSCGTGSVASALIASQQLGCNSPVQVHTNGGVLTVQFNTNWTDVTLIGEVEIIYEGVLNL